MLDQAIKEIEGCFSLPELRDLWVEHAEQWKAFPGDQAAEIIRLKDQRKRLLKSGRQYPVAVKMESAILGATVPVELWPDRAEVEGVPYSNKEMRDLMSRGLSAERLREVHEVKRSFEGQTLTIEQAKALGGNRNERGNNEQT
jgi:hypothetical protein